jgi:hypothetical protein
MPDSPLYTYSDTTPAKRVITDIIALIDPTDAPLVDALGGLDGGSSKFRLVNGKGPMVEWLEDTHLTLADSIDGSITSTATTITMHDASPFQEGDILIIGSEYVWVSSVALSTQILTVTRAFDGTTNASAADDAAVTILGMAREEGDESDDVMFADVTAGTNYTQIFHKEIKVSRSLQQRAQYGIADEFQYQQSKAVPDLMRRLDKWAHYSKAATAHASGVGGAFGGYQAFVTTNKLSGSTLAKSQFDNAVLSCYNAGGSGDMMAFVPPALYQKLTGFYEATANLILHVDRTETTVGMDIRNILTPYGNVKLVMDRWCVSSVIPLINLKDAGFITYYPFTFEPLAKTGDYERGQVVGEFTFVLRNQKSHALLTNCS